MASTPDTSFNSDEPCHDRRGRATKRREATPSTLPSPQPSLHSSEANSDSDAHEIKQAYQAAWSAFCGQTAEQNLVFHFIHGHQRSYELLHDRLAEHEGLLTFFVEEVRKDWNATTGVLVLRIMPAGPLHEIFQSSLVLAIEEELDRVGNTQALRPFRDRLCAAGTTKRTRHSRAPVFERSPDGQWHYSGSRYSPFILEVAYSQRAENLADKVTQFFEQLPNGICNVLGINIGFAEGVDRKAANFFHTASVSLWTSRLSGEQLQVTCMHDKQVFRDHNGHATQGELRLPFTLFLPFQEQSKLRLPLGAETDICLTFTQLCALLDNAEQRQRSMEKSASPSPPPGQQPQRTKVKRVTFSNEDGTVTRDTRITKRLRTGNDESSDPPSARTRSPRSASQPRRPGGVRSSSRGRV